MPAARGRVPVERARRQVHASCPGRRFARQVAFWSACTVGEKPARQTTFVEPVRPVVAEQERGLRGDVGGEAGRSRDGDLVPTAAEAGRPVAGSIRWCCSTPAAEPAPLGAAARREAAGDEAHGAAARSATSTSPRVARSPPAETKPWPVSRPSASSTAIALTTPFRSSFVPRPSTSTRPKSETPNRAVKQQPGSSARWIERVAKSRS